MFRPSRWLRGRFGSFVSRCGPLAVVCALCGVLGCGPSERDGLARALIGRGRVAVLGDPGARSLSPSGTELAPLSSLPPLAAALDGDDPAALGRALDQLGVQGILVEPERAPELKGLGRRLAGYERIAGLQGAYLSRSAALYVLDPVHEWSPELRAGLATVTRKLLGGASQPRMASFPEAARRLEPVEVMVLLRNGDQPRLWRSARGSSFARALLTAAAVARQRWIERATALGGRLNALLPTLTVELSLLQDDGEIATRTEQFIDIVTLRDHGVGYERKGGWHYLLPEATHKHGRKPSRAYRQLFRDDGLPPDSFKHSDLRLYRLAVQLIGISEPTAKTAREPSDGLSDVHDPSEVLGP